LIPLPLPGTADVATRANPLLNAVAVGGKCPITCQDAVNSYQSSASSSGCTSPAAIDAKNAASALCGAQQFASLAAGTCPVDCGTAIAAAAAAASAGCNQIAYSSAVASAVNACGQAAFASAAATAIGGKCPIDCSSAVAAAQGECLGVPCSISLLLRACPDIC
jgi:hypothetical protein